MHHIVSNSQKYHLNQDLKCMQTEGIDETPPVDCLHINTWVHCPLPQSTRIKSFCLFAKKSYQVICLTVHCVRFPWLLLWNEFKSPDC